MAVGAEQKCLIIINNSSTLRGRAEIEKAP